MADEADSMYTVNTTANGVDTSPQIALISQYVKDLSFENPNAPAVYQWQEQPNIDVQFNIGADKVGDEVVEISLKIDVKATTTQGTAFAVDLLYAALFGMRNVPEDQFQPFMVAEAPRLIFPFARRVLSDAVRDGGFPPLLLDPIDFGALYMQQAEALAQTTGEPAGNA
ncbi:MAG: protein-export chaperone SecB [bacterium]|nr:protein-export chaperone SecB [bacterium]